MLDIVINHNSVKMCKYYFVEYFYVCSEILCVSPFRMGGLGGFPRAGLGAIFKMFFYKI